MLVYINDILIMGKAFEVEWMVKTLGKIFSITDLGRPTHFLGVKIDFWIEGIFLSQLAYIKVTQIANIVDSKPTKHTIPMSHPLYDVTRIPTPEETEQMKEMPFRRVLRGLIYLSTRTLPDIEKAVSMIAKFQLKLRPIH